MTLNQNNPLYTSGQDLNSGLNHQLAGDLSQKPVDIHQALSNVKTMPEFMPKAPSFWEDWLKNSSIQPFIDKAEALLKQLKDALQQYLNNNAEKATDVIPQQVIDTITYVVSIIIVLASLFLLYMLLSSLKRFVFEKNTPVEDRPNSKKALQTASIHLKNSQDYLSQKKLDQAMHQLYLAWLSTLDEQKIIPYDDSRSNQDYQQELEKLTNQTINEQFNTVMNHFESSYYGKKPLEEETLSTDIHQFQSITNQLQQKSTGAE